MEKPISCLPDWMLGSGRYVGAHISQQSQVHFKLRKSVCYRNSWRVKIPLLTQLCVRRNFRCPLGELLISRKRRKTQFNPIHAFLQSTTIHSVKRYSFNLFVRLLAQAQGLLLLSLSASSYSKRNPHPTFLYTPWSTFIKIHPGFLWIIITQLIIHSHSVQEYNIHTFIMCTQVSRSLCWSSYNYIIELFAWKFCSNFFFSCTKNTFSSIPEYRSVRDQFLW